MKGTSLETDVFNTRDYLKRCENVFIIARWVQRRWRGYKGRVRFDDTQERMKEAKRYKVMYDNQVHAVATAYVPQVGKEGYLQRHHFLCGPQLTISIWLWVFAGHEGCL